MRSIFPDLEDALERYVNREIKSWRYDESYVELVSFGMQDVQTIISATLDETSSYARTQLNNLAGSYLRDVIRGEAAEFESETIRSLDDDRIVTILDRVEENALSAEDKNNLFKKISEMKGKKEHAIDLNDRYLAHYFSKLIDATNKIESSDQNVRTFAKVANAYLEPSKRFRYDDVRYFLSIVDDNSQELELKSLSSGEKQIVSLFTHLYLAKGHSHIVIIDEPELSLSVPWQKKFLPDILASQKCSFLFAVTHSPFVYDNDLEPCVVDLRKAINPTH